MNRSIISLIVLCCVLFSCNASNDNEIKELIDIVNQLKTDQKNQFLSTLKPSEEDLGQVFQEGEAAEKVISFSNFKWADISLIPEDGMKPITDDAELKIMSATKSELKEGITNGIPREYMDIADRLKDGTKVYVMAYLNEDGSEQKMRSAFFKVSGRWILIPRVYKAFE